MHSVVYGEGMTDGSSPKSISVALLQLRLTAYVGLMLVKTAEGLVIGQKTNGTGFIVVKPH